MTFTFRQLWGLLAGVTLVTALASLIFTPIFNLDPCHLCIVQRTLFLLLAVVAGLTALLWGQVRRMQRAARLSGVLFVLLAAFGAVIATYQSWLQWHITDEISCVSGSPGLLEQIVDWLGARMPSLFLATGFCEEREWVLLGLSLANWALLLFLAVLIAGAWALWRDWQRTQPVSAPSDTAVLPKNKQSTRAFISFLVAWSFVILTVTGVVLYVVPPGRIGNWTFWTLGGLSKDAWANVHILFGAVFIIGGGLHLYYNWKTFKRYLAERIRGHVALKRELVTSLGLTVVLTLGALFAIPPISWLFDLNDWAKSAWTRAPGHQPPYPRAENTPLPELAEQLRFELDAALEIWREAGIEIAEDALRGRRASGERAITLAQLARANDTTPAVLFAMIKQQQSLNQRDHSESAAPQRGQGQGRRQDSRSQDMHD